MTDTPVRLWGDYARDEWARIDDRWTADPLRAPDTDAESEGTRALTGCGLLSCVSVGVLAAVFGLAVLLTWRRMK